MRTDEYRVQLDVFSGPLDLLLYLIRRDELDIQDIPLARVTEQYLDYVRLLEQIDPNAAGEFLVMASTLIEMKSRALLPSPPLSVHDAVEDPRAQLVRQLLEYKTFKDAARSLSYSAEERARRYSRRPPDLPPELQGVELEEVQIWDLLAAFSRVMTSIGRGPGVHQVTYDERPIEWYQSAIVDSLERGLRQFNDLFADRSDRNAVVGTFLALLELMRSQRVRVQQDRIHGTIYLFLVPNDETEPVAAGAASAADPHAAEIDAAPPEEYLADGKDQ